MIAAAAALLSGAWGRIAIVVAIIAALVGAYVLIRQSGADAARATIAIERERDDAQAGKVRAGVDGLGSAAVDERLRQFQRR